ncbi:MAG: aldo/keto reductase [Labilithrix sp.]|nr:aldo/keto reductase [Labilithrix sp.]
MSSGFSPRSLGSAGPSDVGPLGLGSSFGLPGREVERAFERGVNFFLWGSLRRSDFGVGLRNLARDRREEMVVAIQSYTRFASLMEWSVDRALRFMRTDYVDVLCLAWWNGPPPRRIVDAALTLRDKGKIRSVMVSCHHRPAFEGFIRDPAFDSLMLRYNAAHPGAEREIFPLLDAAPPGRRPGTVAFTATRWGTLLDPRFTPEGEATPRASDCYRFALSSPHVDVCLAGPKDAAELDEALLALERGPMSAAELAWMRRVGAHVRSATATRRRFSPIDLLDRLVTLSPCAKQLSTGAS